MFTMFRPTHNWADGSDELSIEVVAPPFYKQRLGLTPTACVRCRAKKVRLWALRKRKGATPQLRC